MFIIRYLCQLKCSSGLSSQGIYIFLFIMVMAELFSFPEERSTIGHLYTQSSDKPITTPTTTQNQSNITSFYTPMEKRHLLRLVFCLLILVRPYNILLSKDIHDLTIALHTQILCNECTICWMTCLYSLKSNWLLHQVSRRLFSNTSIFFLHFYIYSVILSKVNMQ